MSSITPYPTPNPDSMQFKTDVILLEEGTLDFKASGQAASSPLASSLFRIPGVAGVFIGRDFITVTKEDGADWDGLIASVSEEVQRFLESGGKVETPSGSGEEKENAEPGNETARRIQAIINGEIRPAVAMDGGDIVFDSYEDGIVKLHLRGACSSCPSSILTLKAGIENRLKQLFPEVREVVAL